MNAGTIVGYVTRPNGSPVSGAEIRIARTEECGDQGECKPSAKTDSRGYFQLAFTVNGADLTADGGKLNISVNAQEHSRENDRTDLASESRWQVKGYVVKETAELNA